jgi:hypothetical protein
MFRMMRINRPLHSSYEELFVHTQGGLVCVIALACYMLVYYFLREMQRMSICIDAKKYLFVCAVIL